MTNRKILHIDMDAFFASIEQRERPELVGTPVIIAGDPNKRGVVSTCSYEARTYGIYSSMPSKTAHVLCPNATFIKPRIDFYKTISNTIFDIYKEYTELVEPLSLDEAFIDVTYNKYDIKSAVEIAKEIKRKIREKTNLTASAGVSFNKCLAKIASDYRKPDGLTEITTENYQQMIDVLPIEKFFGIGKVSLNQFHQRGIFTGKDLRELSEANLVEIMHKRGSIIYQNIRGIDDREVDPDRQRKTLGKEITFAMDITTGADIRSHFEEVAVRLEKELINRKIKIKTVIIKIKYFDFSIITKRYTCDNYIQSKNEIMYCIDILLKKCKLEKDIRLIGIYTSNLLEGEEENKQLSLWDL
ncbi:DNA polymerase IV [Anaerocolumna xylanovorans]|uniref:DNA polymerase IV n=1 Tax=Anaerocolumna xylanovorans DSM 12503 TaxID=1121345 RepID=A0A1M7XZD7_9FIRM|nr:DNA polymerase IV [Anaerocolumna xylanovorans]SHO44496.1 DNA polymerase-4 [Anaerocolumna xylanovorans DSM 12503]